MGRLEGKIWKKMVHLAFGNSYQEELVDRSHVEKHGVSVLVSLQKISQTPSSSNLHRMSTSLRISGIFRSFKSGNPPKGDQEGIKDPETLGVSKDGISKKQLIDYCNPLAYLSRFLYLLRGCCLSISENTRTMK